MSIDIVRGPGETVWINGKQVWPMPALANRTPEQPAPRKHRWGGCKLGGSPVEESSTIWVRYCEDCGMEDTCEDPLPPCPGPEQPAPKQAGDVVERMVRAAIGEWPKYFADPPARDEKMYLAGAMTAALAEAHHGYYSAEEIEKAIVEELDGHSFGYAGSNSWSQRILKRLPISGNLRGSNE